MTMESSVGIAGRVNQHTHQLAIVYRLENRTNGEIGVFGRIPSVGTDGIVMLAPSTCYLDLEGTTLCVRKIVLPIPSGLRIDVRIVPGIVRLAAGESLEESIELEIPVKVFNPYRELQLEVRSHGLFEAVPTVAKEFCSIDLQVGFFRSRVDHKFVPLAPAYPDVWRVFPDDSTIETQQVVSTRLDLASAVQVLDYQIVNQ